LDKNMARLNRGPRKAPRRKVWNCTGKLTLAALLAALAPLAVQAAGPPPIGAGSILQQAQPAAPPTPSSTDTGLGIEQNSGSDLPLSAPFAVKTIRISGNTLFDTNTLHALVADAEGKELTLRELGEFAFRISDYYHAHGYPLARAIVPAQTIQDGLINIEIVEARFGKIVLDNQSRVKDTLLQSTIGDLKRNAPIEESSLDRSLLLLSDIPGVVLDATLKPGDTKGTSDLQISIAPGALFNGNLALDDYGNPQTGRARAGATTNFIDPLHQGDVLTLSGLTSGTGMNYGRIAYEWLPINASTGLGGSYSYLRYALQGVFASLEAHGTAQVDSLWAKHTFVRSTIVNLYGQIEFDRKELRDNVDTASIQTYRHLDNWTASLTGDARDTFLSGAANAWNLSLTSGRLLYDNGAAQLADAQTANTQGVFSKFNANFTRLQGLSQNNSLYFALSGQWASRNVDPSEKMISGGPFTVRAYDMAVVSGDSGYLATAEFKRDLGSATQGQLQGLVFVDSAHVKVNKVTWAAGANDATLTGAGTGLNWTGPGQWTAKAYVAAPIGSTPTLVGSRKGARVWVEIGKDF
jgi:hemolysin activation/secretion protein